MTFTVTPSRDAPIAFGDRSMSYGSYSSSGATTSGNVDTSMKICESFVVTNNVGAGGSAAITAHAVRMTAFPAAGNSINITFNAGGDGTYIAIGY